MSYSYTNSKGKKYYLHKTQAERTNGDKETIYYFNEKIEKGACHVLPSGKIVVENDVTGIPIVKEPKSQPANEKKKVNWLIMGAQFAVVTTAAVVIKALSWGLSKRSSTILTPVSTGSGFSREASSHKHSKEKREINEDSREDLILKEFIAKYIDKFNSSVTAIDQNLQKTKKSLINVSKKLGE